jgi:hypothetical protein
VSFNAARPPGFRWNASVPVGNSHRYKLGYFETEIAAAQAYDKKCWELHHDEALLNFPRK